MSERKESERRRLIVATAGRCTLTAGVVFAAYVAIPIGHIGGVGVLIRLLVCIGLFFGIIAWHVRSILRSDRPQLRAVEALASAIAILMAMFSYVYLLLSSTDPASFSQPLDRPTSIYFTTTILATVGFGDIVAVSTGARMVVTVQMVLDLVVIGLVVRVLFGAAQRGVLSKSIRADLDEPAKDS